MILETNSDKRRLTMSNPYVGFENELTVLFSCFFIQHEGKLKFTLKIISKVCFI